MLSLLQEELKTAMKAKDKATLTGLRNIIGKIKIRQIDKNIFSSDTKFIALYNGITRGRYFIPL